MILTKKNIFIYLLFLAGSNLFAQSDNYIKYYRNIEDAYQKGVFTSNNDSTIFYLNAAFSNVTQPFSEDYFVIAQAYLGLGNNEKHFEFLIKSIETGIDSSVINKYNSYSTLNEAQKNNCIIAYNNFKFIIDSTLFLSLDSVCKGDQRVRRNLAIFGPEEGEKHVKFQDSLNREWLITIIKSKGWPGRKIVGSDRSLILLLHLDLDWTLQNFELLKLQIEKGNLDPSLLAGKLDHHYYTANRKIIYNSFMPSDFFSESEDEEIRKEKRSEIGALSRKVFETRNYKYRKWKPTY